MLRGLLWEVHQSILAQTYWTSYFRIYVTSLSDQRMELVAARTYYDIFNMLVVTSEKKWQEKNIIVSFSSELFPCLSAISLRAIPKPTIWIHSYEQCTMLKYLQKMRPMSWNAYLNSSLASLCWILFWRHAALEMKLL